jgi:hypothetical protein
MAVTNFAVSENIFHHKSKGLCKHFSNWLVIEKKVIGNWKCVIKTQLSVVCNKRNQ